MGQWYDGQPEGAQFRDKVTGQVLEIRGGRPVVLGSSQAMVKQPKADEDALAQMTASAIQSRHIADRAQEFVGQMGNSATGPIYSHVDLPFVGNINPMEKLGALFDHNLNTLDSINNQTWPELRPTGSGPMRNTEVSGFKTAFPSTANWGPQNQDIAKRLQGEAQDNQNRAAFVSTYVKLGKGTVADGLAAFQRWKAGGGGQPAPRAAGNMALQQRSAQANAPMKIDLNGNPVP